MSMPGTSEVSFETNILARTVSTFRTHGRMDMAFGGWVLPRCAGLEVTEVRGALTCSVNHLVVHNGAGIGGKALTLARPVSVTNYLSAQGITHVYDHAVRPEALETVAVLPILVDDAPRIAVYLATRTQVALGDRWFDSFRPLIRRVERDIAVDDEVRRRLTALRADAVVEPAEPVLSRAELRDIAAELAELAGQIEDEGLRARVEAVRSRFAPADTVTSAGPTIALAPREIEVLQQVAKGMRNREIGESLGLLPNTVKTYLKTAMRKLHASNRVQAILLAREAGFIR